MLYQVARARVATRIDLRILLACVVGILLRPKKGGGKAYIAPSRLRGSEVFFENTAGIFLLVREL